MLTNNEVERDENLEPETPDTDLKPVESEPTESEVEAPAQKGGSKLILRLTLSLLAITSAVALLLAGVNAVTAEPIAEYKAEKRAAAMEQVLPERPWLDFDSVEITVGSSKSGASVTPMLDAAQSYISPDGLPHALCVETFPSGYGGEILLMTGIAITPTEDGGYDLSVQAVRIVSHSETSGIGSKTADESFLSQYEGKHAGITIGSGDNSIDAISGASVSSRAITAGVNEALDAAQSYVTAVLNGEIDGVTAFDGSATNEGGDAR